MRFSVPLETFVIIRWPHRDPIVHYCMVDDSQLRCGDGGIGSQPEQIARPPQSVKAWRFSAEHKPMGNVSPSLCDQGRMKIHPKPGPVPVASAAPPPAVA